MITRFAPSPTGPLHLGHAYSAILAHDMAMAENGTFLLRIEDIDQTRCKPEWEAQIYDDLRWLGLWWPEPVMRQSERLGNYGTALDWLWDADRLYPCTCSRRDILEATSAPQEGVGTTGPDGVIYPRTCAKSFRGLPCSMSPRPVDVSLRLDTSVISFSAEPAIDRAKWFFREEGPDHQGIIGFALDEVERDIGDVVLARKGMGTSYHLSVVLDDAAQGITHVVRGQDLFEATKIQVILQRILQLPTPIYHHHRLIRDDAGKRLAKRDDAKSIAKFRAEGATPADIRTMVGL